VLGSTDTASAKYRCAAAFGSVTVNWLLTIAGTLVTVCQAGEVRLAAH